MRPSLGSRDRIYGCHSLQEATPNEFEPGALLLELYGYQNRSSDSNTCFVLSATWSFYLSVGYSRTCNQHQDKRSGNSMQRLRPCTGL